MNSSIQSSLIRLSRKSPLNDLNPNYLQSSDILNWISLNLTATKLELDCGDDLYKFLEPNSFEIHRLNKSIEEHEDLSKDNTQYFGYLLFRQIGGSNTSRPELSAFFFENGRFKKGVKTLDIGKFCFFNQRKSHALYIPEGSECSFLLFPVVKRNI